MARGRGLDTREGRRAKGRPRRGRGRVMSPPAAAPFDARALRESATLTGEGADERARLQAAYDKAQSQLGLGSGASSPYGAAAENKSNLENAERGIKTTAGNNLYSGATLNAARQARSTYDKTQKRIENEFAEAQNRYTGGIAATARDEATGQAGIKGEAIERAAATEPAPLAVGNRRPRRGGRGRLGAGSNVRGSRRPERNRGRGRI